MDRRIDLSNLDLDRAVAMIADRRTWWSALGLQTSAPTWMDNAGDWPRPLLVDRCTVHRPCSLGLRLHGGAGQAEFVLYAGGWVDIDRFPAGTDEMISEYVELDDIETFGVLLDRITIDLTGGQTPGQGQPPERSDTYHSRNHAT